jgi:hypothetical protein
VAGKWRIYREWTDGTGTEERGEKVIDRAVAEEVAEELGVLEYAGPLKKPEAERVLEAFIRRSLDSIDQTTPGQSGEHHHGAPRASDADYLT